jgi:hypothetical protein
MGLKDEGCGLNSCGRRQESATGFCEHGSEHLDSIKGGKYLG